MSEVAVIIHKTTPEYSFEVSIRSNAQYAVSHMYYLNPHS